MNSKARSIRGRDLSSGGGSADGAFFRAAGRALWRCGHSADDGQSLAEFGLVLPLLLLVLSGIFSFGIIFNQFQILTNATNDSARAFALSANGGGSSTTSNAPNGDPCAYVNTLVQADAPSLNSSNLTYSIIYTVTSTTTSTTYTGTGSSAPTCAGITMTSGDTVKVTVKYPVTTSIFQWATKSLTLSSSSTELVQ
jgi:Flp pilus assembly protein TadG